MWMALANATQSLVLVGTTSAAVLFCGSYAEEEEENVTEPRVDIAEAASQEATSPDAALGSPGSDSAEGSMLSSKSIEFSTDHPDLKFVLQYEGELLSEDFYVHLSGVASSAAQYVWSVKKRLIANSAAWKDLAKRITTLQTEGFDVKPGSDEAKVRRLMASQRRNKPGLLDQFDKKKKKKKVCTVSGKDSGRSFFKFPSLSF
ncbi:unnamed protein product [Haemonchus placei]|uniref:KTSC domain-containing protein n=1 Tax=Haemonchus placei TaxID=6290 RepID=A0A0N4WS97_HAEPC|nr:unnamed protein product [Haemonchus placei]